MHFGGPTAPHARRPERRLLMSLFADLLGFYGQFGFEPLPELSVTYGAGIGLHGSVSRFVKDRDMPFLWTAPTVQWDARVTGECMVVFMDLDAGGRGGLAR